MEYKTIELERHGSPEAHGAWIWLNRPQLHNAFDEVLIAELSDAVERLGREPQVRAIVLAGRGKSFSAGGDLNWMKRQAAATKEENLEDARRLAALFRIISESSKPTIARVHGAAMGGGMGLASACDICIASESASFATSEVRLGLAPGVISPYVIRAIGERQAYRYFQTAERIGAARAREIGLVHEVVDLNELDAEIHRIVQCLLDAGPQALRAATSLIRKVANAQVSDELVDATAHCIAELRATEEAQEGLSAFLEKRSANWRKS